METVTNQYLSTIRSMHLEWVTPRRQFANIVVSAQELGKHYDLHQFTIGHGLGG